MKVVSTEIFKYNELSEKAKEKAREWYRKLNSQDNFWSESVIDDAKEAAKHLGFHIDKVYFSGFWSQGSGACFEGIFRSSELEAGGIRAYAPQDTELQRIADEIEKIINQFYLVALKVRHSGHYSHENCTDFTVSITDNEDNEVDSKEAADAEKNLIELSKSLMKWIYRNLEKEYEYQNTDEQIVENIEANDYNFTESGKVWH